MFLSFSQKQSADIVEWDFPGNHFQYSMIMVSAFYAIIIVPYCTSNMCILWQKSSIVAEMAKWELDVLSFSQKQSANIVEWDFPGNDYQYSMIMVSAFYAIINVPKCTSNLCILWQKSSIVAEMGIFTVTGPFSKTLGILMFPMCITLQTVYHHIKLTYER